MSNRPSLTRQVESALTALERFDQSRREAKRVGQAHEGIHSFGTRKQYQRLGVRFAKWCQAEFGVRWLKDIMPGHAQAYIAHLRQQGRSPSYIGVNVSAVRKLDVGTRQLGWVAHDAPRLLEDERGRHSDPRPTPYTSQEAERLIAALYERDPQFGQLAELQRAAGLRRQEAVHLQARCIAEDGGRVTLAGAGTHAKGGREREIAVSEKYRPFLVRLREQGLANTDGHVFQYRQTLGKAYDDARYRACARLGIDSLGTHGLRKYWAAERYQELREAGLGDKEAKRAVTEGLGHGRVSVLRHYLGGC